MKKCKQCSEEKSKSEFYKKAAMKDGLQARCKLCVSEPNRKWYIENKEKHKAYHTQWIKDNQDRVKIHRKTYKKSNVDKTLSYERERYKNNKDEINAKKKLWRISNPEKYSAMWRSRRARRKGAPGRHTASDVNLILESQRGLCATCEIELHLVGVNKFHVDHIKPLALGGSNDKYNLQCLCPPCNRKKSAKDPLDWAKENGKLL